MREARPLDLNYGHLGEPVYDSESHQWHFPRVPHITRQFKPVGEPIISLTPSSNYAPEGIQDASKRLRNIKALEDQYPELQPAGPLLPELGQYSEAVNEAQSVHDPNVSDLLAFGQLRDPTAKRKGETAPVIAVAGGFAGEALRLVCPTREQLGWPGEKKVHLKSLSCRSGEEALWQGNGSPIQQLVFAVLDGRPSSWLAVRYHGAISFFRPLLGQDVHKISQRSVDGFRYRLDPNLIVSLPIKQSRGVAFADVGFNPWDNQRIATIDQDGYWTVWDMRNIAPKRGLWTVQKRSHGNVAESEELLHDLGNGWGAVLWAGNINMLVVARRQKLAVFDVDDNAVRLTVPDFFYRSAKDWILDIKRNPWDPNHVFVTTSSTLFWLCLPNPNEIADSGVQCLLSWRHFRNEDISLRMNILPSPDDIGSEPEDAITTILLYSRMNGLTSVFTLRHSKLPAYRATSVSDPCLLQLPRVGVDPERTVSHHRTSRLVAPLSCIAINAVSYGFHQSRAPSGVGQLYLGDNVKFYQLSILTHELSLLQQLYAGAVSGLHLEIRPPDTLLKMALPKTPAKILDNFIVSDESEDENSEGSLDVQHPQSSHRKRFLPNQKISDPDARTVSFEWLSGQLPPNAGELSENGSFHDILQDLRDIFEDSDENGDRITETLLGLTSGNFFIIDLDKATVDFQDLITSVTTSTLESGSSSSLGALKSSAVSPVLTPSMWDSLGLGDQVNISDIHENLVTAWVSSLPHYIPSRARIALEKLSRNVAVQMCLASYATYPEPSTQNESETQEVGLRTRTPIILPVRRRASVAGFKSKEPALGSSSPTASSQISEDVGFLPSSPPGALPTPEPTPSLHSQSFVSTTVEDVASQRLQGYASLAPQPALPAKLSKLRGHWQVGVDPASYNWEAMQQAPTSDDQEEANVRAKQRERAKKRQKRMRNPTIGASPPPQPKSFGGSQPQQVQDSVEGSSQAIDAMATASQAEPGRLGSGEKVKRKKSLNLRPAGFK